MGSLLTAASETAEGGADTRPRWTGTASKEWRPTYSLTSICLVEHIQCVFETFAALAEPSRFRIVELLRDGPLPVGTIGTALGLNQPQVSKHLRALKEARLVDVEPRAQQRLYGLSPAPLRELHAWLERYRSVWDERMDNLEALISDLQEKDRVSKMPSKKKVKR